MVENLKRALLPVVFVAVVLVLLGLGEWLAQRPVTGRNVPGVWLPAFSPLPGVYDHDVRVTIRPTQARGEIVFTVDGTLPTADVGILYQHPLYLDATAAKVVVIRVVEVVDGVPGPVTSATYVLGVESRLPVVSLIAEPADLWDAERGLFANTWGRGIEWERPVHVDYVTFDGGDGFSLSGGLRIHGAEPASASKQSLRLYFRSEYGAARLSFPLFPDHPHQPDATQSYKRLLLQAGDRAGRWMLFRDQLVVDVATDLGLRATQGRFVHLFVNGESWGLYRLSERIDRFFLVDNLGRRNADVVQDGRPREGSDDDWDALVDWVAVNDLSDPANFDRLAAQVDLDDLTDWAVVQLYFGFPAEVLYAARSSGGWWFFLYEGGGPAFAQTAEASLGTLQSAVDADFAILLRALLKNPAYRERFARRLIVLLNTTLSRTVMQTRALGLVETLRGDIAYEEARWPAPFGWRKGVDAFLVWFAAERPQRVLSQAADVLGLGVLKEVRVATLPAPESGRVYLEGVPLPMSGESWTGHVLSGVPVAFTAVPARDYGFAGWSTADGAVTHAAFIVDAAGDISARFEPLDVGDVPLQPDDVVINEVWINDNGTSYASVGNRSIEGDWIELRVQRDGVDLRGWRLTDNDTITGTLEGSLIFPHVETLASVPRNTVVLILATVTDRNALQFPVDDVNPRDRRLLFYVGNDNLDAATDPGFGLGTGGDNLVLLAPGVSTAFADDIGIDFVAEGNAVTPFTFGVLKDGVAFDTPLRHLSDDDGAIFVGSGRNDAIGAWLVDPPAYRSGDELRVDSPNVVTPGTRNPPQHFLLSGIR